MAKATALDKVRRVRQRPKPKSQSAPIGPDGPKHPGNRQLYDKRGRPDAGARLYADYPNPKVATFCTALWLTFTLPLTGPCGGFWEIKTSQQVPKTIYIFPKKRGAPSCSISSISSGR
jgi:hypothetical protein